MSRINDILRRQALLGKKAREETVLNEQKKRADDLNYALSLVNKGDQKKQQNVRKRVSSYEDKQDFSILFLKRSDMYDLTEQDWCDSFMHYKNNVLSTCSPEGLYLILEYWRGFIKYSNMRDLILEAMPCDYCRGEKTLVQHMMEHLSAFGISEIYNADGNGFSSEVSMWFEKYEDWRMKQLPLKVYDEIFTLINSNQHSANPDVVLQQHGLLK